MKTCSSSGKDRKSNEYAGFLAVQTTAVSPCTKSMVGGQANKRPKVCVLIASSTQRDEDISHARCS